MAVCQSVALLFYVVSYHEQTVIRHYLNTALVCWGLFPAADSSTFGVVSIYVSRTVYVGLIQNKLQCVCS